jgi:hypothetical protein
MNNKLIKLVDEISCDIWKKLHDGYKTKQPRNETSITDFIWEKLLKNIENSIAAQRTDKGEDKTGADLEWWIWDNSMKRGIALRIQAKKIDTKGKSYPCLDHKVNNIPQIDLLLKSSELDKVVPLYCFYNYIDSDEIQRNNGWEYAFAHNIFEVKEAEGLKKITKRAVIKDYLSPMRALFSKDYNPVDSVVKGYINVNPNLDINDVYKTSLPPYIETMINSRDLNLMKKFKLRKGQVGVPSYTINNDDSFIKRLTERAKEIKSKTLSYLNKNYYSRNTVKVVEFPYNLSPNVNLLVYTEID